VAWITVPMNRGTLTAIILYGEFIMSAVNHPPHAADPLTGHEEKS